MMFCLPDIGQTAHMYLCCVACTHVCGLAAPSIVGYYHDRPSHADHHREDMMATQLTDIVESPQPERLATGFVFTEGPCGILMAIGCSWMCVRT